MMKTLSLIILISALISCGTNEDKEEKAETLDANEVSVKPEDGQILSDSTADQTGGNGSQWTPSDNTQENKGNPSSPSGGQ